MIRATLAILVLALAEHGDAQLAGQWAARLTLRSPAEFGPRPTGRVVTGNLIFGPAIPDPFGYRRGAYPPVRWEFGRSYVDFTPFFGGPVSYGVSTSVVGGTGPLLQEAEGYVDGDSVFVDLIPRMSHGGLSLSGRIHGDSIVGEWFQRAFAGGATGRFTMHRFSHTTPEVHDFTPAPPPPEDRSAWGWVRVRAWDESSHQYIVLAHALHHGDEWTYSYHTGAGPEGWGKTVQLPPGDYSFVFEEFPCGDRTLGFLPEIERPFTVATGQVIDLTIPVHIPAGC